MQPVRTEATLCELLAQRRWRAAWGRIGAGLEEGVSRLHDAPLDWYDGLSRTGRDRVDQTLHFLAGFGIASVGTAAAAWEWAHRREFIEQAPIERIGDTERDMRFVLYGAWGGQVVWTGWVCWATTAVVRWLT